MSAPDVPKLIVLEMTATIECVLEDDGAKVPLERVQHTPRGALASAIADAIADVSEVASVAVRYEMPGGGSYSAIRAEGSSLGVGDSPFDEPLRPWDPKP